jgi:hypothetical protein
VPGSEEKDGREVMAPRFKFGYRIEAPEWESLKTGIKAIRLHVEEAHGTRPGAATALPGITHADDFTWIKVGPKRYDFRKGHQAKTVEKLFEEWSKGGDGAGLSEDHIRQRIDSRAAFFRVRMTFRNHEALGTILRSERRGQFALFLTDHAI